LNSGCTAISNAGGLITDISESLCGGMPITQERRTKNETRSTSSLSIELQELIKKDK
jgi:hypothetical protein